VCTVIHRHAGPLPSLPGTVSLISASGSARGPTRGVRLRSLASHRGDGWPPTHGSAVQLFPREDRKMLHRVTLSLAPVVIVALLLAQPSAAQTGRGALGGAVIGGLAGGPPGAAIGALVGAGTGALIARQGRRFRGRHYWWHGNCYFHARNGRWYRVSHRYCH